MSKILSTKVLMSVWGLVILASLLLPNTLAVHHWGDTRIITVPTIFWICGCILTFWAGSFIERSLYVHPSQSDPVAVNGKSIHLPPAKLARSLSFVKGLLFLTSLVIVGRFLWAVGLIGGLNDTLTLMVSNPVRFKFSYWQPTNIHGIGMLGEIVVATTIFLFATLALLKKYSSLETPASLAYNQDDLKKLRGTTGRLLLISLLVLTFYLMASNERVPFVGGILGGFIVYYLIRRRLPVKQLLGIASVFLLVWILVEAGRRQFIGGKNPYFILEFAKDRLLLYFAGGIRNTDTFVNYISDHSYGWFTLNFLLTPFKLDQILPLPASFYGYGPKNIRPGLGAIPPFGTAYADFGAAGLGYFLIWGFVYQKLHRLAIIKNSFLFLQLYAYFLMAILVSFVVFLPSYSRFWMVVLGLTIINRTLTIGRVNG